MSDKPAGEAYESASRQAMVATLVAAGAARSPRVIAAFERVERHRFIDALTWRDSGQTYDYCHATGAQLDYIYDANRAVCFRLVIESDVVCSSSSSAPIVMAEMLERLDVQPGMRVVEIGSGSGYNAALLAELAGDPENVTTIEVQPSVAASSREKLLRSSYGAVRVVHGDGASSNSWDATDRVIVTASVKSLPELWSRHIVAGGKIVFPWAFAPGGQVLVSLSKCETHLDGRTVRPVNFMALRGPHGFDEGSEIMRPRAGSALFEMLLAHRTAFVCKEFVGEDVAGVQDLMCGFHLFAAINGAPMTRVCPPDTPEGHIPLFALQVGTASVAVVAFPTANVQVYGSTEAAHLFRRLVEAWVRSGQPRAGDYDIRTGPALAGNDGEPASRQLVASIHRGGLG